MYYHQYPYTFFLDEEGKVACAHIKNNFPVRYVPEYARISIMSGTGIPDKNGQDIYEGDICVFQEKEDDATGIGIILNWVGGFVVRWVKKPINCKDDISPLVLLCDGSCWSVIGNAKENQEFKKVIKK